MIDYAVTQREILESERTSPAIRFSARWVRERIVKSDVWMEQLEELNLKEVEKAPQKLRDYVAVLANDLEIKGEYKALVLRQPISLLDLVFEIQEALFERGRYRELLVCDERQGEEGWSS